MNEMEYREFSFRLCTKGIEIEAGYQRFCVGYFEQSGLSYDTAVRWCREQGGQVPTLEQALVLAEHRYELNEALRAARQREIGEYIWTRRRHAGHPGANYVVCLRSGNIDHSNRNHCCGVRAVVSGRS